MTTALKQGKHGNRPKRLAPDMRLPEKTLWVTGAASGIAWPAATRFLQEGARVVLADLPDSAVLRKP